MSAIAGRVLILPKGDYDASITYEFLDLVNHNSSSWLAKKASTGIEPSDANSEFWQKFGSSVTPDGVTIVIDENGVISAVGGTADKVTYENESVADVTNVKEALDGIFDGTQQVGDSAQLGGKGAEEWKTELADLKTFVGYFENGIVGVEVDFVNKTFTRLADAVSMKEGADFSRLRAFGGRRRCNVANDGTVNAYYGELEYTENGSNGQVMVEQPKFYYRVVPLETEEIEGGKGFHLRKAQYYVSDTLENGFKVHPSFVRNGVEKDFIYLSAYEGCTYDVSASSYNLTDAQTVDWTNDLLSSIANAKPTSGETQNATRAGFRAISAKRGNGWTQATIQSISATELLMLVEYATFNMQTAIGDGAVNKTGITGNASENTGATALLGNVSGAVTNANDVQIVSYRGEENFWGNIWKFVDGINSNITDGVYTIYIADNSFADESGSGAYKAVNISPSMQSGYPSAWCYDENCDWLFIPSEVSGDSALPVGDLFSPSTPTGWRTSRFGGGWDYKQSAGAFCFYNDSTKGSRAQTIGGRLLYVPQ